jgi:hypothetical protein
MDTNDPTTFVPVSRRVGREASPLPALGKALLIGAGLVAIMTLFIAAYSGAFSDPQPHHIPVAVEAPGAVTHELTPSAALDVQRAGSDDAVRHLIADRSVYGGLIIRPEKSLHLEIASGAGHSVAIALTAAATALARNLQLSLTVTDVAPLSDHDPSGSVEFYAIVFLSVAACFGAVLLSQVIGGVHTVRDALRNLTCFVLYAAILAAAFVAVTDAGFGALVGHAGWLFLILWAYGAAVSIAIAGLVTVLGRPIALTVVVLIVLLGNTSCGGPVGRPLLDAPFSTLTPVVPQGAGLDLLRGGLYFHGDGVGSGAVTLAVWCGIGVLLLFGAGIRPSLSATPDP